MRQNVCKLQFKQSNFQVWTNKSAKAWQRDWFSQSQKSFRFYRWQNADKTLTSHWCSVQCTEYDGQHILSGLCLYSKQSVSLLSDKEINIHSREIVYWVFIGETRVIVSILIFHWIILSFEANHCLGMTGEFLLHH